MFLLEIDANQIVHGTADASFVTDRQGRILGWNEAAERLLGHGAHQVLGRSCRDVICFRDPAGHRRCDSRCALLELTPRSEPVRRVLMHVPAVSGKPLPVHVSGLSVVQSGSGCGAIIHLLHPARGTEGDSPGPPSSSRRGVLTNRERVVLQEVARGLRNRQVAQALSISEATVRSHLRSIFRKLEAKNRLEAVTKALWHDPP